MRIGDAPEYFVDAFSGSGAWANAAEAYQKLLETDPHNGDPEIHHSGAEALAHVGRWTEAAAGFRTAHALNPANNRVRDHLMRCYVALNDVSSYRPLCKEKLESLGKNEDPRTRNNAIRSASVIPGVLSDYANVLLLAKKPMDSKSVASYSLHTYGALLFRAKQYQGAANYLRRAIDAQKGKDDPFDWVFLAMARHRLKLATAKDALNRAIAATNSVASDWELSVEIGALIEEAKLELGTPLERR